MVEPILGMAVLAVVGLRTGISLLSVWLIVRAGRALLLGTGWRSVVALWELVVRLRSRLRQGKLQAYSRTGLGLIQWQLGFADMLPRWL